MNLQRVISRLKPGNPVLVVDRIHHVNHIRELAKEGGKQLKQQKIGQIWEVSCVGPHSNTVQCHIKRIRTHRLADKKWRSKHYYPKTTSLF